MPGHQNWVPVGTSPTYFAYLMHSIFIKGRRVDLTNGLKWDADLESDNFTTGYLLWAIRQESNSMNSDKCKCKVSVVSNTCKTRHIHILPLTRENMYTIAQWESAVIVSIKCIDQRRLNHDGLTRWERRGLLLSVLWPQGIGRLVLLSHNHRCTKQVT